MISLRVVEPFFCGICEDNILSALPPAANSLVQSKSQCNVYLVCLEADANQTVADAEFSPVSEHGGAHALLFIKCPVGGIHVFQIDVRVAYFQQAVMPGDFRVVQSNVRPFAP